MKNIENVFKETLIEVRRQQQDFQEMCQQFVQSESTNERLKIVYEQSKNVDKKYREQEQQQKQLEQEWQEQQQKWEEKERVLIQESEEKEKVLKQQNQLLLARLYRHTKYSSDKVDQVLYSLQPQCICMGQVIQIHLHDNHNTNNHSQPQKQKKYKNQKDKANTTQQQQQLQLQQQQQQQQSQVEISDEICLQDKYDGLLEEYKQKCNESEQQQKRLDDYDNNLEQLFYQSEVFQCFLEQTGKLDEQNQRQKCLIKDLECQVRSIETLRQKELDELEKIANFNLSKLQQEVRQVQSERGQPKDFAVDIQAHVQPLVQGLEQTTRNLESVKQERDQLFQRSRKERAELDIFKQQLLSIQEKVNWLEIDQLLQRERGEVDYEHLAYKGGRYKDLINQLNRLLIKSHPQLKGPFDELVLYLKTREQKIDYLENKNKGLQKEVRYQQKQGEDLIHELDLTGTNYSDILARNRKLLAQIKDQEETFEQLAKEKLKEKQKWESERGSLVNKVRVDGELVNSQNQLVYDLECQVQLQVGQLRLQGELQDSHQDQLHHLQRQLIDNTQQLQHFQLLNQQYLAKVNRLEANNSQLVQQNTQLSLQLKETQKFIDRRIALKRAQSNQNNDDSVTLQQLEFQQLQQKINCSVCQRNHKKVILQKCSHMFCKDCLEKTVAVRNRACPICKNKFGQEDIKEIYFT